MKKKQCNVIMFEMLDFKEVKKDDKTFVGNFNNKISIKTIKEMSDYAIKNNLNLNIYVRPSMQLLKPNKKIKKVGNHGV